MINKLLTEATSIHWHGLIQQGTPFMDGAAYVTQCPILPRESFTYRFTAQQSGTFWYHAHLANQRNDGLQGMLILHAASPLIPYFNVMIQDWIHRDAITIAMEDPSSAHPGAGNGFTVGPPYFMDDGNLFILEAFESGLINGRGRWNGNRAPLTVFTVTSGRQYRFRVVNSGLHHSLKFEIDNHQLLVVAIDGSEINSVSVDAFILMPAERVDCIIVANQQPSLYWIRVSTLVSNIQLPQINGILSYSGAPTDDPKSTQTDCTLKPNGCFVFNCLFGSFAANKKITCASVDSVVPVVSNQSSYTNQQQRSSSTYKYFDIQRWRNFNLQQWNPYKEIFLNFGLANGPSINGISNSEPRALLYGQASDASNSYVDQCDQTACSAGCSCTNIISLPYNKIVQFVVTNYANGSIPVAPHTFHTHGHSFTVLKMGYQPIDNSTGKATGPNPDVTCADSRCFSTKWANQRPSLNLVNPPVKDTIVVPSFGYVVLRITTDNPGLWLVHCHLESHMMHGMSFIINEAEPQQPSLPLNFPSCGDFV